MSIPKSRPPKPATTNRKALYLRVAEALADGSTFVEPFPVIIVNSFRLFYSAGTTAEQNQSNRILLSFVQGRRCLHPTNKDPFAGTLNLLVAST
jgi:hypothetical protein